MQMSQAVSTQGHFASPFGGLWTDRADAAERLAERLRTRQITRDEAKLLQFWMTNGYVILPKAVSHWRIDAALADIAQMYAGGIGYVENLESDHGPRIMQVDQRQRGVPHKLLEAHGLSVMIRKAVMSSKVTHFLNLIFDEPALAFQGLYFERGSQQAMHQDSAFVRINRPMEMAASWLAMEDIQEGSGELTYFVGSHRIPDYLFDGKDKWMPNEREQYLAFIRYLGEECQRRNLRKETFLPKKGDVLIWSADLVHGGAPITRADSTRRSFVNHWCPATAAPLYFASPDHRGPITFSKKASYSYLHYGEAAEPLQPTRWQKLTSVF